MSRVLVLLSGGLDSATCLAIARGDARPGGEAHALSFDYGQRSRAELAAARRVAAALGATSHRTIAVDLRALGGSALTSDVLDVPKGRSDAQIGHGIPITYVPARNLVFLSLALAAAETLDADAIYVGVNALDTSGYPDCRPAFLDAFREAARLGTRRGDEGRPVEVRAPLLALRKADIAARAVALGVPVAATLSCYDPVVGAVSDAPARHCGRCDACRLRRRGFLEAGLSDPSDYAA